VCGCASILFPPVGIVGVVLGVVALVQLRTGRERGRGLAVAGLALSLVWVLLLVAGLAVLSTFASRPPVAFPPVIDCSTADGSDCPEPLSRPTRSYLAALQPGDCLEEPPASSRDDGERSVVDDVLDCDQPHRVEVYDVTKAGFGAYSGDVSTRQMAQKGCQLHVPTQARSDIRAGLAHLDVFYPGPAAWDVTHDAACVIVSEAVRTAPYAPED
jgi:hypothetical protein